MEKQDLFMDTKKIKAMLTAVERGSLSAAAEELGYTQSGLTHMMNSLEEDLGLTLLIRSKAGVRISPAGQALLEDFNLLISASDTLERNAESLRERTLKTDRKSVV